MRTNLHVAETLVVEFMKFNNSEGQTHTKPSNGAPRIECIGKGNSKTNDYLTLVRL